MNRSRYFNFVEECLSILATRFEVRGKLNVLDMHLHSEDFYLQLFNTLFGWQLRNLNAVKHNVEAIDLIDQANRIVVQVSATATKTKVESALDKDLSGYADYSFKFISISKDASHLRTNTYKNIHGLKFDPKVDIFDIPAILKVFTSLEIRHQRAVWDFIKEELSTEVVPQKLESNLAVIIDILSKENWSQDAQNYEINDYEIEEKITYNQLTTARTLIDDYKIHSGRVDAIYAEFDRQGVNKSQSVLDGIRRKYFSNKGRFQSDELFFRVIDLVMERIRTSANFTPIPAEELDLSVGILVVDAFIRCKIFENPVGEANAAS